jgi:hypothetical protein
VASEGVVISGTVRDPAGRPVPGARVYFIDGPGPFPDVATVTGDDGAFMLSAPTEGRYTIECAAEDRETERVAVEATSGRNMAVEIRLK